MAGNGLLLKRKSNKTEFIILIINYSEYILAVADVYRDDINLLDNNCYLYRQKQLLK